jgi:hypothetical protein
MRKKSPHDIRIDKKGEQIAHLKKYSIVPSLDQRHVMTVDIKNRTIILKCTYHGAWPVA